MIISPLFYENFDNNHCLQASMRMILNSFGHNVSQEKADILTSYDPELWTWLISVTSAVQSLIPGTKLYSNIDYSAFAQRGEDYIKNLWDKNSPQYIMQKTHSSNEFRKEQKFSESFFQNGGSFNLQEKVAISEVNELLKNYILLTWVNWNKLYDKPGGPSGHFVVVYGEFNDSFILHDSGRPPHQGKKVNKELFHQSSNELLAIPKGELPVGKIIGRAELCYCGSCKKFKKCHMKILQRENRTIFC